MLYMCVDAQGQLLGIGFLFNYMDTSYQIQVFRPGVKCIQPSPWPSYCYTILKMQFIYFDIFIV